MTNKQFLQQFGHFIEAPNGIQKLRELILTLAVQGKLLPQDSNDEPASVLLENIEAEKNRLIKESKISKGKGQPTITEEEFYFPPPMNWKWAHLDDISQYIQRGKGPTYAENSDFPVVSQKCIQWAGFDIAKARFIEPSALEKYQDERFLQEGDLLWNSTGTGTIGRINVFPKSDIPFDKVVADSHVTVVRLLLMNPRFVWIWIASPYIQATIEGDASGSTNQVELATSKVKWQPTPIPPLPEQHRIVAKVDELMSLCDRLETERNNREATHQRLIRAVHNPLTEAADATATTDIDSLTAWHRIRDNFADLYTTLESVQALRQTILQLAVQGKLVPQDANEEAANKLFNRIQNDINLYGTQNNVRPVQIDVINDETLPFNPPDGWVWTRLAAVCRVVTDGDHQPPPKSDNGVAFLTIGNVSKGTLDFTNCRYVTYDYFNQIAAYRRPEVGDLLYTVVGATYGRPIIVETKKPFCVQRHIAIIKPARGMSREYLHILLSTPFIYEQATQSLTGTAQPTVPLRPLRNFLVPLPPLDEQHRIVTKVDELMALGDQLEANIRAKSDTAARYAETVVQQIAAA